MQKTYYKLNLKNYGNVFGSCDKKLLCSTHKTVRPTDLGVLRSNELHASLQA